MKIGIQSLTENRGEYLKSLAEVLGILEFA
jgi:hypothetical protein